MRKIYFKGHEITSEDCKNLDYQQGNYLDKVCDAFCDLTKEEKENGVNYGDFFIIEEKKHSVKKIICKTEQMVPIGTI